MSTFDRFDPSSSSSRGGLGGGGGGGEGTVQPSPRPLFSNSGNSFRSPGSSRLQSQRHRSMHAKKPPEPLRRAVADCLSSSHYTPSPLASEAARTLRDYLMSSSTTNMAYSMLIEHTLSERDRSPAVVAKCVALLKRYLLRYIPALQTLQQIDIFCLNSIAECDAVTNRRVSPWLNSINPHVGPLSTPGSAGPPSIASAAFASGSLIKSLNYVRSLVAQHIRNSRSQPSAFAGTSNVSRQYLPALSAFLNRSFTSQLSPGAVVSSVSSEIKEVVSSPVSNLSFFGKIDDDDLNYASIDVHKWRWNGDKRHQHWKVTDPNNRVIDCDFGSEVIHTHNFREVGAAALLADVNKRLKTNSRKHFLPPLISDPDFEQLLQPSALTTTTNIASACSHLKAITASKRVNPGAHQVWEELPLSSFGLRSRPLFQYRHYSEQQPLRLSAAEVEEVIAAASAEISVVNSNSVIAPHKLTSCAGRPSSDVAAVSVLIKLVIDMYVADPSSASPLILSMLQEMLSSSRMSTRVRAFDLIINLGVHAHLLEPSFSEDSPIIEEEESSQEPNLSDNAHFETLRKRDSKLPMQNEIPSAVDSFESWILDILYELLLLLVQNEEMEETVWAAGLSCLLYLVCDNGRIWRKRLKGLDIRVMKSLLEISRQHSWAEELHSKLVCMLSNLFYKVPDVSDGVHSDVPVFNVEQVELLGGIEFVCMEYSRTNTVEEKRNLFAVLFDYVLCKLNERSLSNGDSVHNDDEVRPLAVMLDLVDAPQAFYMAIKHGVYGMGELLRQSITEAVSDYLIIDHLNTNLLDSVTTKLDSMIRIVSHLDEEFIDMMQTTKIFKSLECMPDNVENVDADVAKARLAWSTLHSLLHSKRTAYRQNGYIWLVELLVSDIIGENESNSNIWINMKKLQLHLETIVIQDTSTWHSVPLTTWVLCGMLKSKCNYIRWGFLFVLEKFLMQCQLLFNKNSLQHENREGEVHHDLSNESMEKANAVIGVMNSALLQVVSINETDRINVMKMCDLLFSQLCVKYSPESSVTKVDCWPSGTGPSNSYSFPSGNGVWDPSASFSVKGMVHNVTESMGDGKSKHCSVFYTPDSSTASMAATLLSGHAGVSMQLVGHVSTDLFFWPLIQLASAATDNIALGVSVGSEGRGGLPGSASDTRAALLLLLIGKCTADPAVFQDFGGEEFFRRLLDDTDARVAYYTSAFLLKRMMTEDAEKYQRILHVLVFKAQQLAPAVHSAASEVLIDLIEPTVVPVHIHMVQGTLHSLVGAVRRAFGPCNHLGHLQIIFVNQSVCHQSTSRIEGGWHLLSLRHHTPNGKPHVD